MLCNSDYISLSFPVSHRPDPLQEAPQASKITLVVEVGPLLLPSLVVSWTF